MLEGTFSTVGVHLMSLDEQVGSNVIANNNPTRAILTENHT